MIPAMLPFGVVDVFFSTLDIHTLVHTFSVYGRQVIRNLAQGKI